MQMNSFSWASTMIKRVSHFFFPSLLVATGVIAWESFLHSLFFGHAEAGELGHVARDVMLAWPLAFAALAAGPRVAGRLFGNQGRLARAASSAPLLFMMMIPAVSIHEMIDARLAPMNEHGSATPMIFGWDVLAHGVRDAALALVVAFPLVWVIAGIKRRPHVQARFAAVTISMLVVGLPVNAQPVSAAPSAPVAFSSPLFIPPVLTKSNIAITMKQADLQILPGPKTRMWTYNGIFPGPTIRRPSGTTTRVTYRNNLPAEAGEATVHLHGSHSASSEDGQPDSNLIPTGGKRTYHYDFVEDGKPERAKTRWYHDHRMDHTGRNVYMGLAGMHILDDAVDSALPLPKGAFDVPMMLTDRSFDANNQLDYQFARPNFEDGSYVLVNGAIQPYFKVAARRYRFRVLNASNNREYRLELSNGADLVQIASESGLLPHPVLRKSIVIGPAERVEVVVDFAGLSGTNVFLKNTLAGKPAVPAELMQFRVQRKVADASTVPANLRPVPVFDTPSVTRVWTLDTIPVAGMVHRADANQPLWFLLTINGKPFDANRVDARPVLGATEKWIFINTSPIQHRMHIHDVDWQVVSRTGGHEVLTPGDPNTAEGETGLRETFLVQAGKTVTLILKFTDHIGPFMLHCHILEHEDNSMMAQFEVVPPQPH